MPSRDSAIWYTGQRANVVGRFDPATRQFKEYALPTPNSGPHGIIADRDGNIWYTGNAAALIGRVDPKTGKIALYSPQTPNARPYGIKLNSKGVPFFDEFNAPRIGSVDPQTMKITEYPLPDKGARPRRIAIAKDDAVYYTDYARGYLGRLDAATGKVEEFKSPGGDSSKPYAIGITSDGAVWYCETGNDAGDDRHNMLVRFNPETKKMQAWPIPGGGGTVRNLDIAKGDVIWLAESGVGKLARVQVKSATPTLH